MNLASNTFKLLSAVIRINLVMLSIGESVNTIIIVSFEVLVLDFQLRCTRNHE